MSFEYLWPNARVRERVEIDVFRAVWGIFPNGTRVAVGGGDENPEDSFRT